MTHQTATFFGTALRSLAWLSGCALLVMLLRPGSIFAAQPEPAEVAEAAVVDAEHQQRLQRLLLQDCGSCHGLRMKGGLGPALTAEVLRDKSEDMLVATVLLGRPGTAMPRWEPLLDRAEAQWMIRQLKKGGQP